MKFLVSPGHDFPSKIAKELNLISKKDLLPIPDEIAYIKTIFQSSINELMGLVQVKWPSGIVGTGINLIQLVDSKLSQKIIQNYETLNLIPLYKNYVPRLRFDVTIGKTTILLFTWPETHSGGYQSFASKRLSEILSDSPFNLQSIKGEVSKILDMYSVWTRIHHSSLKNISLESVFHSCLEITNPPVSPNSVQLDYGLNGIDPLPNPIAIIQKHRLFMKEKISCHTGFIHGNFTSDRIFVSSPPITCDWSSFQNNMPVWIDLARFELDLLQKLLPHEENIWKYEWSSIVPALKKRYISPNSAKGRLSPSALEIIEPIRRLVSDKSNGNGFDGYWISAVRAGLDSLADHSKSGPSRLVACLYASVALDNLLSNRNLTFETSLPSQISWPGLCSWRSLAKKSVKSGYCIILGSGYFPKDGKIDQLPQVETELYEVAKFFDGNKYEVHLLIDENFSKEEVKLKFKFLEKRTRCIEDTVIIYFSGHGVYSQGEYYLLTSNSALGNIENEALKFETLLEEITKLSAKNTIIIINSCYSGQTLSSPPKLQSYKNISPLVILASTSEGEQSYFLRDDPFSIFTETFLEALGTIQKNKNPIYLFDLLRYVVTQVPIKAKKIGQSQNPSFLLNQISEDFQII